MPKTIPMPIRVTSKRRAIQQARQSTGIPFGLPAAAPGAPQKPAGISLCMIVKNEERFLAQCLQSVADIVDEMVIVDTGSTDRTIEIAKSFGAVVLERQWRNDFAWARNEALAGASMRWILVLDADEELLPESKPALRQLKDAPAAEKAVWLRCYNRSDDYRGTGDMSHALMRIFPNTERIRFRGLIHEYPSLDGSESALQGVYAPVSIVHHGYLKEIVEERNKKQRNLDIVKASVEADPSDPFHWFNLGTTAFIVGDYEQARDALEEMIRINGSTPRGFIPNGYAVLAEAYCDKLEDPARGEEIARKALEFSPHYANAHFQLGKSLVAQRRFDDARVAYQAAIDDREFAHQQFVIDDQVYIWKAHSEIGTTYVMQGDHERALEWFARGLANAPNVHPLQVNYARSLDKLERLDEAEAAYRSAFETHRDNLTAIDYVNFLLRRQRPVQALEIVEGIHAQLDDNSAVVLLVAAAKVAEQLKFPNVDRYLLAAAERAPGNSEILNPLETLLRGRGDIERVEKLLAAEAQVPPQTAGDWLRRSHRALSDGRFDDALNASTSGLMLAPDNGPLHYNSAIALANLLRKEEALEHLARVGPDHTESYQRGGLLQTAILREMGRLDEALALTERLLSVDETRVDALLLRGVIQESLGDLPSAESSLNEALRIDPRRAAVELSAMYLRAGRFSDAARIAEAALAH